MLLAVSNRFTNPIWVASGDTVGAAVGTDAISTLNRKAMLAAKTVSANSQTQMDLILAFTKFVEVERRNDDDGKAENQLMDHISAMPSSIKFNVGGRDPLNEHAKVAITSKFQTGSVDPTFEEQLRYAAGLPVPGAEALLTVDQGTAGEDSSPTR